MMQKTLTPSLIKKLNDACEYLKEKGCSIDCNEVGWCEACWLIAKTAPISTEGGDCHVS